MKVFRSFPIVLVSVFLVMTLSGYAMAAEFPEQTHHPDRALSGRRRSTDVVIRPLAEAAGKILGQPMLGGKQGRGRRGRRERGPSSARNRTAICCPSS